MQPRTGTELKTRFRYQQMASAIPYASPPRLLLLGACLMLCAPFPRASTCVFYVANFVCCLSATLCHHWLERVISLLTGRAEILLVSSLRSAPLRINTPRRSRAGVGSRGCGEEAMNVQQVFLLSSRIREQAGKLV